MYRTARSLLANISFGVIVAALAVGVLTTPAHAASSSLMKYSLEVSGFGGMTYPQVYASASMPELYVYQGYLYRPGVVNAIYPGPAVYPVEKVKVPSANTVAAIEAVYAAAVAPAGGFGRPPIEDAPTTRITVRTPAGTRTITVYLPSIIAAELEGWVGAEKADARRKLAAALDLAYALEGPGTMYRPARLELWRTSFTVDPGIGSGAPLKFRIKPSSSAVRGCETVSASALPKGANQISTYRFPDGKLSQAVFRPVLPGEKGCQRVK